MRPMDENGYIAVGIDGSAPSTAAALWAGEEADRRGVPLMLIQAYSLPIGLAVPGVLLRPSIADDLRSWAEATLTEVESAVYEQFPFLQIEKKVTRDVPAEVLRKTSARALMTVVGSHGHGEFIGTVLGSVALALTSKALGPVVVVRDGSTDAVGTGTGPVVVCVDGSTDPETLLPFAFEQADLHGAELLAVHCWRSDVPVGLPWPSSEQVREHWFAQEQECLSNRLSTFVDRYPRVAVRPVVLVGRAATSIIRYCSAGEGIGGPSLLVVGSRGRGVVPGLLFGSTSHTLVTHAPCPVAVVPQLDLASKKGNGG